MNRPTHTYEFTKTSDEFARSYSLRRTFIRFGVGLFPIERIASFDLLGLFSKAKKGCAFFDTSSYLLNISLILT